MATHTEQDRSRFGSDDLRMPQALRESLVEHLDQLRERYARRGWGGRVGFGEHPAVLVIDLARFWLDPQQQIGSSLNSVVAGTCRVLRAARAACIPIFFTTFDDDPAHPPSPHDQKLALRLGPDVGLFELDPRLERRPTEKLIYKRYASAFKGTALHEMLASLAIDTLIVTGISTSHCVYATCRDATDSFRVIVPREAVGERCELMHEVFLFDIDLDLGDVTPVDEVLRHLDSLAARS